MERGNCPCKDNKAREGRYFEEEREGKEGGVGEEEEERRRKEGNEGRKEGRKKRKKINL